MMMTFTFISAAFWGIVAYFASHRSGRAQRLGTALATFVIALALIAGYYAIIGAPEGECSPAGPGIYNPC